MGGTKAEFDETIEEKRPTVQVGDPFTERKLMDLCLAMSEAGLLVALQDLGAAGLTSAASERSSITLPNARPRALPLSKVPHTAIGVSEVASRLSR